MRIMSFGDKINDKKPVPIMMPDIGTVENLFTTWRMPRRDRDWRVGEVVQVVYKTRSPQRRVLGTAVILAKTPRLLDSRGWGGSVKGYVGIKHGEAWIDGFANAHEMAKWLQDTHGPRYWDEPINILLLGWIERSDDAPR